MAEMTARLDHVGLAVADLGAAAAWYCDVFGLVPELSLRVDAIDLSIEMLIHPAFGYRVELLHRPGTGAGPPASRPIPPRRRCARGTGTWPSTSPTSTAPTTAPSPAGRDRSCRRARRRNPGCGWRSSPTPRATSSNFCTGQGGPAVNRILFVNGQVFDGTGAPPVPADVVVRGDRIESVRPGGGTVDRAGRPGGRLRRRDGHARPGRVPLRT